MVFRSAIGALSQILEHYPWAGELAGILPLSALIDFIEVPPKLHVLELVGSVPLWSWVITPSGSRLLLGKPAAIMSRSCCQDRFGMTTALEVLDGRYGERYFTASPETLRLVLASHPRTEIENDHENVSTARLASQVRQALTNSEGMAPIDWYVHVLQVIRDPEHDAALAFRKELLGVMGVPEAVGLVDTERLRRVVDSNPAASDPRTQVLEVVYVSRRDPDPVPASPARAGWLAPFRNACHAAEPVYFATVTLGWILLTCVLIASACLKMWISFAFYLLIPITGLVVHAMYGTQPRRLLVDKPSKWNRLLLVTEHMNSNEWIVVYGESTIVNSLLNRPLHPSGPSLSSGMAAPYRFLLRLCILGQWALVLAAAATKDFNAYFICFWVSFSIVSHSYLATPEQGACAWAQRQANLRIERFGTSFTSRRALLNAIIALNPDSLPHDVDGKTEWTQPLSVQGTKWLDPILKPSESRNLWEKATHEAMKASHESLEDPRLDLKQLKYRSTENNFLDQSWHDLYSAQGDYWRPFIPEGIYVAAKIKKTGSLPGVLVSPALVR